MIDYGRIGMSIIQGHVHQRRWSHALISSSAPRHEGGVKIDIAHGQDFSEDWRPDVVAFGNGWINTKIDASDAVGL